jgi:hypothetical protein
LPTLGLPTMATTGFCILLTRGPNQDQAAAPDFI